MDYKCCNHYYYQVERRPSSHMDLLPTFADLAGVVLPTHLALDGVASSKTFQFFFFTSTLKVSIAPLLMEDKKVEVEERPVFFYRGNLLYAVRMDSYKVLQQRQVTMYKETDSRRTFSPGLLARRNQTGAQTSVQWSWCQMSQQPISGRKHQKK